MPKESLYDIWVEKVLVMEFRKAQSRKRRLKLAMAAGVSRNDANKVLWMEKTLN